MFVVLYRVSGTGDSQRRELVTGTHTKLLHVQWPPPGIQNFKGTVHPIFQKLNARAYVLNRNWTGQRPSINGQGRLG